MASIGRKKLLILSDEIFPYGWGIGRYTLHLCKALASAFEVEVMGTYDPQKTPEGIFSYGKKLGFGPVLAILKIWRSFSMIRRSRPDSIICAHPNNILTILLLEKFGLYRSIPKIFILHGSDIVKIQKFGSKRKWLFVPMGKSHHIVTISEYVDKVLQEKLSLESTVIYNTISSEDTDYAVRENSGTNEFLMVSRLDWRKGFRLLIDMLNKYADELVGIHIRIVGGGVHREAIEAYAKEKGALEFLEFLGAVSDQELQDCYTNSKFLLFPSIELKGRVEGFGLVVLESIQYGCVPIVSRTGGQLEVVGSNYELSFDPEIDALYEIIKKARSSDLDAIKTYLDKRLELFSFGNFTQQYVGYVQKVLDY